MMKKILFILAVTACMIPFAGCNKSGGNGTTKTEDSLSVVLGQMMSQQNKMQQEQMQAQLNLNIDSEEYLKGYERALMGDTTATNMSYNQGYSDAATMLIQLKAVEDNEGIRINRAMFFKEFKKLFSSKEPFDQMKGMAMQQKFQALLEQAGKEAQKKIATDGEKFLKEELAKGDYKQTKSGIAYKVVKEGKGAKFKMGDNVMVKYEGTHVNGRVFDGNLKEKEPTLFPIDETQLIKGFVEVMQMMSPGSKMHVIIPAKMAYGEKGNGKIKPNETLVFDIETIRLATAEDEKKIQEQQPQLAY